MVTMYIYSHYVLQIHFMIRNLEVKMGPVKHLDVRKEGRKEAAVIPCPLLHLL